MPLTAGTALVRNSAMLIPLWDDHKKAGIGLFFLTAIRYRRMNSWDKLA
jgi:hypothetical protein